MSEVPSNAEMALRRITSAVSTFALCAAGFAYSVTHWAFPSVGFEGMLVFGAMSFWLGVVASGVAALMCAGLFLRKRVILKWPLAAAAMAGTVLFVTVLIP
jgi:hypothetical protein